MSGAMSLMMGGAGAGEAPASFSAESSDLNPIASFECIGYPPSVCPVNELITTGRVYINTAGGSGAGPTYLWTRISGDVFTIENPTGQNTTFSILAHRAGSYAGVYRCATTHGAETINLDHDVVGNYTYETGM
jgi:hypothetical protein